MKEDQLRFMSLLGRLPARLSVEQTAWVLNCQPHDIPILFASKLLKPLGNPPVNGIKIVCTDDLLELVKDRSWLAKVTNTIHQHWQLKNRRRVECKAKCLLDPSGRYHALSSANIIVTP